jgi:hypothetical protein
MSTKRKILRVTGLAVAVGVVVTACSDPLDDTTVCGTVGFNEVQAIIDPASTAGGLDVLRASGVQIEMIDDVQDAPEYVERVIALEYESGSDGTETAYFLASAPDGEVVIPINDSARSDFNETRHSPEELTEATSWFESTEYDLLSAADGCFLDY